MLINKELKYVGKVLIERTYYDLVRNYSAYDALKARFAKSREDMSKLNKIIS